MNILFINAIADDNSAKVSISEDGQLRIILSGSANLQNFLSSQLNRAESTTVSTLCLGPSDERKNIRISAPDLVVNEISEPDSHVTSLEKLAGIVAELNCPVINPPAAIIHTRRENLATQLAPLQRLKVPTTLRITPDSPRQLLECCQRYFPGKAVLVRGTGDHGGVSTIRLAANSNEQPLHRLPFDGRHYLLSEYIDYSSPDGLYRKYRVVLIGDEIYLRHMIVADKWMIHSSSREFMQANPGYAQEEAMMLQSFTQQLSTPLLTELKQINRLLGTDYLGLDCAINADGTATVFELNANMNILVANKGDNSLWQTPIDNIRQALLALIYHKAEYTGGKQ
ncbi:MAG: hypothetical protein OIF57_14995 [Marinobacterium sp.]|nr:hypothetical protein [Marinobacterium sp.]